MKGLYRGKYLIAIYDKNDYLVDVACKPEDLSLYKDKQRCHEILYQKFSGRKPYHQIYFIDVTKKHNDIFAEEDELFLQYVEKTRAKTNKEEAERLGVNVHTYSRHKENGTLYKLEKKLKQRGDYEKE